VTVEGGAVSFFAIPLQDYQFYPICNGYFFIPFFRLRPKRKQTSIADWPLSGRAGSKSDGSLSSQTHSTSNAGLVWQARLRRTT